MPADLLSLILDGPFELQKRPEPLPGDLRLAWGMALVVLLLGRSRGKQASLQKLHFLAHSARTRETRRDAERLFSGELSPAAFVVRFEPWLNRALAFSKAVGLVDLERGKTAKLTTEGVAAFDKLNKDEEILAEEKNFITHVAPRATERAVEKIMRMETLF
jgi:hypothetical protein